MKEGRKAATPSFECISPSRVPSLILSSRTHCPVSFDSATLFQYFSFLFIVFICRSIGPIAVVVARDDLFSFANSAGVKVITNKDTARESTELFAFFPSPVAFDKETERIKIGSSFQQCSCQVLRRTACVWTGQTARDGHRMMESCRLIR